ncbi:hypothetical protein [Saccharothrix sp. HUAS TT1]|uniref:hypothetical protein n=1 Tax=unclassified Saccharothrix TaxID=2593673 RepID=UPI00345BAD0C
MSTTDGALSAEAEAEHVRMAEMLCKTLRELNMAHDSVNGFYASDNSHQANAKGWRALKPYAAVQHALRVSLLELCGGNEEQAEWIDYQLCDNGEDVAYNLAEMRKEWAFREEMALVRKADDLLIALENAQRGADPDELLVFTLQKELTDAVRPLVGNDDDRAARLVREAQEKRWYISDFELDELRKQWAQEDAQV